MTWFLAESGDFFVLPPSKISNNNLNIQQGNITSISVTGCDPTLPAVITQTEGNSFINESMKQVQYCFSFSEA